MIRPTLHIVSDAKEAFRLSLILAALENLMKYDECAVLRAACRARYLDLTDGCHDAS
ncbi:hypothetical protein [Mesorhizobium sp. B2-3-4]|uniref:hypothetical protein n=1 Tax=Mesorhizobium sp. B2-3-4 TaxID=2589959 RepID=UPI0015E3C996|nr:hypothetical protein [Mesorhizobium sp. B2-3-4]